MARDGASSHSPVSIFKIAIGIYCLSNGGLAIGIYRGSCDEECAFIQIAALSKTVLNIVCQALGVIAAVLLHDAHLAVLDLNAGLQIQQIGAQSGGRRAAAAFYHILQTVQKEAGLNFFSESLNLLVKLIQTAAFLAELAGVKDNETLTGGEVLGINDPNIGKIVGCDASVLIAGGKS